MMLSLALAVAVILLAGKIYLLEKNVDEIRKQLGERLVSDTNNLLFLSSRDRHVRRLASDLNEQLKLLRAERRRFQTGDQRLKEEMANISHDLRTPLTAISGYLDLLEGEPQSETVARYLDFIRNRTETLTQLTQELFTYTLVAGGAEEKGKSGGQGKLLDVNGLLEESLLSYYGAFQKKGITPRIRLPDTPVKIYGEASALGRIFGNIISNGLKYSDGDFSVTLTEEGRITFSNQAKGLTPVLVEQIFQRYYTVETGDHSTGLGLAIARELTQGMGGSIGARYRDGRLEITVTLEKQG